jgi:hypothetical protein
MTQIVALPQTSVVCRSLQWTIQPVSRLLGMAFVIKANDAGRIGWIAAANHRGFRSLADRAKAAEFATREEAQMAIDKLPEAFARAGIRFSIEPADSDS